MSAPRWTRRRRAAQALVAILYLLLPLVARPWLTGTVAALRVGPVDLVEPAGALSVILAAGALPAALALGALPVLALAVALGPVYCSWCCPWGLLSEAIDRVRAPGARWPERAWVGVRALRIGALAGALLLSAVAGAPLAAVLSPPRLLTALPLEAWSARVVPWVTLGLLGAFLTVEVLGPRRIVCRALCPAGALAALMRRRFTWGPRFERARCPVRRAGAVPPGVSVGARPARDGAPRRLHLVHGVRRPLSFGGARGILPQMSPSDPCIRSARRPSDGGRALGGSPLDCFSLSARISAPSRSGVVLARGLRWHGATSRRS